MARVLVQRHAIELGRAFRVRAQQGFEREERGARRLAGGDQGARQRGVPFGPGGAVDAAVGGRADIGQVFAPALDAAAHVEVRRRRRQHQHHFPVARADPRDQRAHGRLDGLGRERGGLAGNRPRGVAHGEGAVPLRLEVLPPFRAEHHHADFRMLVEETQHRIVEGQALRRPAVAVGAARRGDAGQRPAQALGRLMEAEARVGRERLCEVHGVRVAPQQYRRRWRRLAFGTRREGVVGGAGPAEAVVRRAPGRVPVRGGAQHWRRRGGEQERDGARAGEQEDAPARHAPRRAERLFDEAVGQRGEDQRDEHQEDAGRQRHLFREDVVGDGEQRPVEQVERIRDVAQEVHGAGRGAGAEVERAEHQQRGGQDHDQRGRAGVRRGGRVGQGSDQHAQRQPPGRGRHRRRAALQREHRADRAGQQFPGAEGQQEEGRLRLEMHGGEAGQQAAEAQRGEQFERIGAPPVQAEVEQRRQHEVVLFLQRQRPGVQQRLERRGRVEVARLLPQHDVGGKAQGARHLPEQFEQVGAREQQGAERRAEGQHRVAGRQQAPEAAGDEAGVGEGAALDGREDVARDQEAGEDEEHVHPEVAAGQEILVGVVEQHGEHRQAAQPLDVVAQRARLRAGERRGRARRGRGQRRISAARHRTS